MTDLNKRNKLQRVDENFIEEINEISRRRIQKNLDEKQISFRRLTQAIPKSSKWKELKAILEEAEIK